MNKMVISRIIGGLGNQMFQYAVGRALSLRLGLVLRLDASGYSNYGLHQGFELHRVFGALAPLATETDVSAILGWQSPPWVRRVLARPSLAAFCHKELVFEPHFHYWSGIERVSQPSYLQGNWQSERYFQNIASTIRSDVTFKLPLAGNNATLADRMKKVNSVSVHVRRGDYVLNPRTNSKHGLCSLDYYERALRLLSQRTDKPELFVFSDDISWVKTNLRTDLSCSFVDHNQGTESYNDMRLMSLCRNHIIANSSFSWWGAWLNPSPDKVVVAPAQWFANGDDVEDLLPKRWVTL